MASLRRAMSWLGWALLPALLLACGPPKQGPAREPVAAAGEEPPFDDEGLPPEPLAAPDPELILDPAVRPDWLRLRSGFGPYRGVPALVALGTARSAGELPMARLVARRRARSEAHRLGAAAARYLGRRTGLKGDALVLLETQLQGILDTLLPDQRRFVPTWQDVAQGQIHAAVLIPLDRFLDAVRESWAVPDSVRAYLAEDSAGTTRKTLMRRYPSGGSQALGRRAP